MSRVCIRWIGVALAIAALALPVQAQNVLTIRVESLDALLADMDTIALALGQEPGMAEGLVQEFGGQLGLTHLDMIDGKSPLVVALPLQGMMLGQKGFVGAFPVADVDATIAEMKTAKYGVTVDEDGLIHVPMGETDELLLLPANGYLIYGQNANLIGGFDPAELLAGAHLPPGTIAAEFNVDAMRAMIGMLVEGLRQNIGTAISEGVEENGAQVDGETTAAMSNTVVEWIQTLVANTRSIQLSLKVSDRHLLVHNHYLPAEASTLASFLKAQSGGMPDLARLLDGTDSSMTMVANVTWTDETIAAFEGFMEGYAALLQGLPTGDTEMHGYAELIPTMMEEYAGMWKCMRGDMAQVVDTTDGLRYSQVSGLRDSEECRALDQSVGEIIGTLPEDIGEMVTHSQAVLSHRGVEASKMSVKLDGLLEESGEDADELASLNEMFEGMFGENGFEAYMATSDTLWLGTGGKDADESMRALINAVKKPKKRGSGIDAAVFKPFDVGAGVYVSMDLGRFFAGFGDVFAGVDEAAEIQEVLNSLGTITAATEFKPDAMALKLAIETEGLRTLAEMAQEDD